MSSVLDTIYNNASAEQARTTCDKYGIQYLVVRVYDPAWRDRKSWVWTLKPVVSDDDFRSLDCK